MNSAQGLDPIIEGLIRGEDYTPEHRREAIAAGIRRGLEPQRKGASIARTVGSLPYLMMVPPILAAIGGDMTGRGHHRLEMAMGKRRHKGVSSTQERLRALAEIAEARGGFAIPGEEDDRKMPGSKKVRAKGTERKTPPPKPSNDGGDRDKLIDGGMIELLD